jgi:trans-2,3-dihydro-3-hydroxyanthranilate isomerase
MAESLDYHVVDVFTDVAYAGNPLAVVLDADDLSSAQLQALAREFHLSETAFPGQPSKAEREGGADYALRIFTPEVELPFAGHPSIGAAWVLAQLGHISAGGVTQACGAGLLDVSVGPDGSLVELTGGVPSFGAVMDSEALLAACGLSSADLDDTLVGDDGQAAAARLAGAGLGYAIVPVRPESLSLAAPDLSALRAHFRHPAEATGVYLVAWDRGNRTANARMFAGDIGVSEDPATGSAALALGVWLVGCGLLPADGAASFTVRQGLDMGRPSTLYGSVRR